MKKNVIVPIFLLMILYLPSFSQNMGLNFQGVARSANGIVLASQKIALKLSIITLNENGIVEYAETRVVNTNGQGIFSIVIGDTNTLLVSGNFKNIDWKQTPKFLKIEMDPTAGNQFITMGITQLQSVPYSYISNFSNGVNAENINGIVPIGLGGTGTNSLSKFKNSLLIDKIDNTPDIDKPISNKTQIALDTKLNIVDTNKLLSKKDTTSLSSRIDLKAPNSRTLSINGTTYDLSQNRIWTIPTFSGS